MKNYKHPVEPPAWALLPAAAAILFILLPVLILIIRAPWANFATELGSQEVRDAIWISLVSSTCATGAAVVLGFPLAWIFARSEFPGKQWVRAAVLLPAVLPPVVSGVALLMLFGRGGPAGAALERLTGMTIPFTTFAVVLAELYISLPFFVLAVEAGLRTLDPHYEEVAATLGAGPWRRFITIILPSVRGAVFSGAALAWARALGEFGATITFAGSFPGRTQTMPLAILLALENRPDGALALSVLMIAIALTIFIILRKSIRVF